MGYFDYSREPKSDIAFVDMKSFYASVECVERGLHPLKTSLCVMSANFPTTMPRNKAYGQTKTM